MRFATENNVFKNCDSEKNKECNVYLNIEYTAYNVLMKLRHANDV